MAVLLIAVLRSTGASPRDREEVALLRPSAALFVVAIAAMWCGRSDAAPPANADPALHGWFESLKQPGSGLSCCSIADCRPAEYRLVGDGYEALLDAKWVLVPRDKVLHRVSNPTGRAIVCRSPISGAILCFVPASET